MYILKKDLPNKKAGTEIKEDDKVIAEILKNKKLKEEWLEVEKTDEEKNSENVAMLENIKIHLENELEEINKQLINLK